MAEGMKDPLARLPLAYSDDTPEDWPDVQRQLTRWMSGGCAVVERDGIVMEITSLAAVTPAELGGAVFVIYHSHVAAQFPWLARRR